MYIYYIAEYPDISVLTIARSDENNVQTTVVTANVHKDEGRRIIKEYGMVESANGFYKTPFQWLVPNQPLIRQSGL